MKTGKRFLSILIVFVMVFGMLPETSLLSAASIDDYKNVKVLAKDMASLVPSLSQGVSFTPGTDYISVNTVTGGDPYFTVDLDNIALTGKVLAIKYRGPAKTQIANAWLYFNTSAGGWGLSGGGVLTTSKLVCNSGWQLTTYNFATELTGEGANKANQPNATVDSIRIGAISATGGVLDVAYVGLFNSAKEAQEYDKLYCKAFNKVDLGKVEKLPPAIPEINPETYTFNYPVISNGMSLVGKPYADAGNNIINHFRRTWTPRKGTGASCYVNNGTNQYYLKLQFDSLKHNYVYTKDTAFEFSADVMPGNQAHHFAGFLFNFGYENSWENNMFYEKNGVNGEDSVGQSGIGVNVHPTYIEIYVLRYDETDNKLKQISYKYNVPSSIGTSFHKLKVVDNATGRISFYLDNVLFAYVEYSGAGLLPASVTNYNESYYRTAEIYNAKGDLQAKATDALIAEIKSMGMGSRARVLNVDNVSLKKTNKGLKINSAYLTLSSDIAMHFRVKKSDFDNAGYKDPKLAVEFNSIKTTLRPVEETINGNSYYVFRYDDLYPKMMKDEFVATLTGKLNGVSCTSNTIRYSISQYLYNMLSSNTDAYSRKMFVDMLNYGSAAQAYNNYNLKNLATSELASSQSFWGTQTTRQYKNIREIVNTINNDTATWKSATLILNDRISIKTSFIGAYKKDMYVQVTDVNGNILKNIYYNEFEQEVLADNSTKMSIVFDSFDPSEFDKVFYFTVFDGTGKALSDRLVYNVESYVASKINSTDKTLTNLCKALMNYGDSAKEYFDFLSTPKYKVEFYDYDGTLLKSENVPAGSPATPPSVQQRADYVFNGWDKDYTNVKGNLKLTAQYGFSLTDEGLRNRMMAAAEQITAFARDNGFTYGNPSINPGVNWQYLDADLAINPNERLVACDRLMSWTLYAAGFTDQPNHYGCDVSQYGFQRINSQNNLWPGDIVFVETDSKHPGTDHVFIIASYNLGGNIYLRYDHGSDARIQCVTGKEATPGKQPFREGIVGFAYALRPSASKLPPQSVTTMQKNPPAADVAYPNPQGTVLATATDWCASTSGTGQQNLNYKYTPGVGYDQFQFETMLHVPGAVDGCVWNSCFVGARLPALNQTPATGGGVWVAFKETGYAYVYAGINPETGNWNSKPLASIPLPQDVATMLNVDIKTASKKLTVVDAGSTIKYYLEANGVRYLVCSINVDVATSRIAVFNGMGKLRYVGKATIGSSGYFMVFAHGSYCNAVGSKVKGCSSMRNKG